METDLKIEREWRGTLQRNLDQEKQKLATLQAELQQYQTIKKVRNRYAICLSIDDRSKSKMKYFTLIYHYNDYIILMHSLLPTWLSLRQPVCHHLGYHHVITKRGTVFVFLNEAGQPVCHSIRITCLSPNKGKPFVPQ